MTSLRSLMLSAAVAVALAAPAAAADLSGDYGGSLKDDMVSDVSMARYYIRGDIMYSWTRESGMTETLYGEDWEMLDTGIENTWGVGGGIGWYLTPNFRADLTVDYLRDARAHGTTRIPAGYPIPGDWVSSFDVQSTVVLANMYYDFGSRRDFNPYIGVGIGWAFNKTNSGEISNPCGCLSEIDGADQTNFAWALMAGVSKDLGHGFNMDLGYRYLDMGKAHTGNIIDEFGVELPNTDPVIEDLTAHQVRLGFRYGIH